MKRSLMIVNDTHLEPRRGAGTTPQSASDLDKYTVSNFQKTLNHNNPSNTWEGTDLVILGDLFDKFSVSNDTVGHVVGILFNWCQLHQGSILYLVRGNHDAHNRSNVMSSLDLVGSILSLTDIDNFQYITEPTVIDDDVVLMPHLANQDLFNLAIEECQSPNRTILAHCNYNNFFAEESDHSLNLSKEQASKFNRVFLAHEHHSRTLDNVICIGNQFPTSVADCKDKQDKQLCIVSADGYEMIKTWSTGDNYLEVSWDQLSGQDSEGWEFVRVVGDAEPEEISTMISEINKFRRKSKAFVVANAVELKVSSETEEIMETLKNLEGFSTLEILKSKLNDKHKEMLEGVL